jgi:hypothetical protein
MVALSIAERLTCVFQLLPTTKTGGPIRHALNASPMGVQDHNLSQGV